jgi:hypothetical protein
MIKMEEEPNEKKEIPSDESMEVEQPPKPLVDNPDKIPPLECDPRTMNCDELRDTFNELSRNKQNIDATIVQLESSKETFNDPKIDEALETAKAHQQNVDGKISEIIEATVGRECKEPNENLKKQVDENQE